jgi:hypothetical protein
MQYYKDPSDPRWKDDAEFKEWLAWMKKYNPDANVIDGLNVYGYAVSKTLEQVLLQCKDDLTRENVMRQAANLKALKVPMLLPGIMVNTGSEDFYPIEQAQLIKFDGKQWVPFGGVIDGTGGKGS